MLSEILFEQLGNPEFVEPVGGGSIGQNYRIIKSGISYFLKTGVSSSMLRAEGEGLQELSKAIAVPKVIEVTSGYLLLEWIEPSSGSNENAYDFGKKLASLHKTTNDYYGFEFDNFLGYTPQRNTPNKSWLEFFWNDRLMYQVELVYKKHKLNSDLKNAIFTFDNRYEEFIGPSIEQPSLIHGDLWSGNYLFNSEGKAYLIDPAAYYGHRELELSMTKLFGGFSSSFYEGYNAQWPLKEGSEERIDFYQVYHLLNHLNLFGMSYYNQALNLIRKYS